MSPNATYWMRLLPHGWGGRTGERRRGHGDRGLRIQGRYRYVFAQASRETRWLHHGCAGSDEFRGVPCRLLVRETGKCRARCGRRHRFWKQDVVAEEAIPQISRGIRSSRLAALCRKVGGPDSPAEMPGLVLASIDYGDAGGALTKARHAISRFVALTEPRPEAKLQPGCAE